MGAWNLNRPIGDSAKGMPRYSDTSEAFGAGWPRTEPLLVWTDWPTFQFVFGGFERVSYDTVSAAQNLFKLVANSRVHSIDCMVEDVLRWRSITADNFRCLLRPPASFSSNLATLSPDEETSLLTSRRL